MYNKKYVIAGIIVFLLILFSPFIYNSFISGAKAAPELEKPKGEPCPFDVDWMRANHMVLLKKWREEVIREGKTSFIYNGVELERTFEEECFKCHTSYDNFCGKCHEYSGATPNCFDCHLKPEQVSK